MQKTNIFGIPVDILIDVIGILGEVVKLFTPNHVSKYQTKNTSSNELPTN